MIGLMTTMVVANVLLVSERQRRSVTSGTDAQVNGSLALYTIQRDVQMAGYGVATSPFALGCEIKAQLNNVDYTFSLAPVLINDGANDAPDSITVMASATDRYAAPVRVVVDHPRTAANFFVDTTVGLADGDLMIAVPKTIDANNWCSVFNVTGLGGNNNNNNGQGQGQNQVIHNSGNGGPWNQPGGQTIFPNAGYPAGSYLLNIGTFINRRYWINNNALQLTSFNTFDGSSTTVELYPGVVNLQAFYGLDTDADGVIDSFTATTPTTNAGWRQLVAVRIAVVARSSSYEKESVTAANPLWDVGSSVPVAGSATCSTSKCVTLKVDHLPDWQRYRYKIFEVVLPVRNMLWHS